MLAGLPKELNAQHESIHLMSASNKMPVMQMIVEDVSPARRGFHVCKVQKFPPSNHCSTLIFSNPSLVLSPDPTLEEGKVW